MKHIRFGDILSVDQGIIVHGCNARGVMGSGLAKQVRDKWPDCYEAYRHYVDGRNDPTYAPKLLGCIVPYKVNANLWVVNAITQLDFGRDPDRRYVSYEAIYKAFVAVKELAAVQASGTGWGFMTPPMIHYPQIGAGLGNGDWGLISDLIDSALRYSSFSNYLPLEHTLWIREDLG